MFNFYICVGRRELPISNVGLGCFCAKAWLYGLFFFLSLVRGFLFLEGESGNI